jgi:hypothetical protein
VSGGGGAPGVRPPAGIAFELNRAKLKDFMALGRRLLHRHATAAA